MLRFIVLGQIPGTKVQINFTVLILIGLAGLLLFEMLANSRRRQALALAEAAVAATTSKKKTAPTKRKATKKKPTKKKTPSKRATIKK